MAWILAQPKWGGGPGHPLYSGMLLDCDVAKDLHDKLAAGEEALLTFRGFTSCSTRKAVAEAFVKNAIATIETEYLAYEEALVKQLWMGVGYEIKRYAGIREHEDEVLLSDATMLRVTSCELVGGNIWYLAGKVEMAPIRKFFSIFEVEHNFDVHYELEGPERVSRVVGVPDGG
jgi:hypothetical protein